MMRPIHSNLIIYDISNKYKKSFVEMLARDFRDRNQGLDPDQLLQVRATKKQEGIIIKFLYFPS